MFALSTIFGLPAHALIVHVAIVLVPLAAVALIVLGWRAGWRRQYGLALAVMACAGAASAFLAAQTGGPLRRSLRTAAGTAGVRPEFGNHPGQGNNAELFAIVFAFTAVAFWAVDRWRERLGLPSWMPNAAYAVALVPAAAAIFTMMLAGHSGATLVWKDVGNFVSSP